MHVCACTRPRELVPTCTHARTSKHAHTDQYVILTTFPLQQWFRKRAMRVLLLLIYLTKLSVYRDGRMFGR